MTQRLVTLRQMQGGVGVITALSLGIPVPGAADCPETAWPTVSAPVEIQMRAMGARAYDLTLADNWEDAGQVAVEIEQIGKKLPAGGNGLRNRFGLFKAIYHLESAVKMRDKWEAAWAANRITLFAARLARSFPSNTPFEVTLLNVYGRDLQVAGARHDDVAAHKALGAMHMTWQTIRPRVSKISDTRAFLGRFDKLLRCTGATMDAEKMGKQATLILAEVAKLKQSFVR